MSDHAWTREHVAAYVVGGLNAEEAERLDAHVRDCPACAAVLADARRVDARLTGLFADVRPGPALEDQVVRVTRAPRRAVPTSRRLPRWAIAASVLPIVGAIGAAASFLAADGRLPVPGGAATEVAAARTYRESPPDPADSVKTVIAGSATDEAAKSVDYIVKDHERVAVPGLQAGQSAGDGTYRWKLDGGSASGTSRADTPASGGGNAATDGWAGRGDTNGTLTLKGANNYTGGTTITGGTADVTNKFYFGTSGGVPTWDVPSRGFTRSTTTAGDGQPATQGLATDAEKKHTLFIQNGGAAPQMVTYKDGTDTAHGTFRPSEHKPADVEKVTAAGNEVFKQPTLSKQPVRQVVTTHSQDLDLKDGGSKGTTAAPEPDSGAHRVVIRSGEMEFEVTSFDVAVATVTRLTASMRGAFVATVNSEKLANGKVRGSITVRTPPEHLDKLVLDLRKEIGGDLKGMKVGSQDITKQYTDLESRLKAARAMEQRLLQMIRDGKGEIKQLLEAEKELGVWRTRIEEVEGELRYYSTLVALSTLTVTLTEKEIRAAAAVTESEQVQAGVEVEDVDAAYRQALAAVADAKGRVTKSEVKQLAAGQFNASLQFEVPPDASGPVRDRLRQLGRVARLEIGRVQQAVGGTPPADVKVKRGDAHFAVQLYNLANIAPRETTTVQVAVPDVRAAYQALREAAGKAAARVRVAQLNEQDPQDVTAQLQLEVKRAEEGVVRVALDAAGDVVARQVTRATESDDTTDSKVLFNVVLEAVTRLKPRETTALTVEVPDVDQAVSVFAAQVAEAKGRQLAGQTTRERSGKVTAKLSYEVPLAAAGLADRFKAAGVVRAHESSRDPHAPAGKFATARIDVTLTSVDPIVADNEGLWPPIRRGLTYSASVLLTSVTWVVFGLCVVLPWVVVVYGGYRLVRRMGRPATPAVAPTATQG